jgi:flagellar hook-associated protein 3 FlgL
MSTFSGLNGTQASLPTQRRALEVAGQNIAEAPVGGHLDAIDARMVSVLKETAAVGARYNQLLAAQQDVAVRSEALQARLSRVGDVDLAETAVQLKLQEVAYDAGLGATRRVLQPSLLDFLR